MKVGDLVQLAWGSHPRRVGMITAIRRFSEVRVKWFGIDDTEFRRPGQPNSGEMHYFLRCLELVNENR